MSSVLNNLISSGGLLHFLLGVTERQQPIKKSQCESTSVSEFAARRASYVNYWMRVGAGPMTLERKGEDEGRLSDSKAAIARPIHYEPVTLYVYICKYIYI